MTRGMFERSDDKSIIFEAVDQSSQPSPGFIAYYLPEGSHDRNDLTLKESWDGPSTVPPKKYLGYYLFLNQKPSNLDAFEKALSAKFASQPKPAHTGFLWLKEERPVEGGYKVTLIDSIETELDSKDPDNPVVVLTKEVLLDFGGYTLPFGAGTRVTYEGTDPYTGFVFQPPVKPSNGCPSDATTRDVTDGVHLTFTGARRGCFECKCVIGNFGPPGETSWDVGLRYAIQVNKTEIHHQFYRVFELPDNIRPVLGMCWDLADQLNPDRTFLEFERSSVKLTPTGEGPCNVTIEPAKDLEMLRTYFRTATGELIGLIPKGGDNPSRLAFERWTDELDSKPRYYLVPKGQFEIALIDLERGAEGKVEVPGQFMCGLSGLESVQLGRGDGKFRPGSSIVFFPHKPAYVPVFPLGNGAGSEVKSRDDLQLITKKFMTAWAAFTDPSGPVQYLAQPEAGPIYTPDDEAVDDEILTFHQPVAATLAAPSIDNCFPMAPVSGAIAAPGAPAPDATFVRNLESQILGPQRRETILKFAEKPADGQQEVKPLTGFTPQGLEATIKEQKWSRLLLAQSAPADDAAKTPTLLEFEAAAGIDSTIQAAFQSNHLFLVASDGTHFTKFKSIVEIGQWVFDLNPSASDPANIGNILILKFSPGKLRDRIRDPRSWTFPAEFNNTESLSLLARKLTAFFDEVIEKAKGNADYRPLSAILDDDRWTGIIGINLQIRSGDLPPALGFLSAGIGSEDKKRFVAHHLVVETSTIEFDEDGLVKPADCSVFGLIDYRQTADKPASAAPGTNQAAEPPEVDFSVKELRALFRNGELTEFSCKAELTLNTLFGAKVTSDESGKQVPGKKILLNGTRERNDGRDTYSVTVDPASLATDAKLDCPAVDFVRLNKAVFEVTRTGSDKDVRYEVTFSFWGTIGFKELKTQTALVDLFSYESLSFSGLMVRMKFPDSVPSSRKVDLTGLALDGSPGAATARPKSLVRKFPMKLQRFYMSNSGSGPTGDGYVPVTTALGRSEPGKPLYGLDFALNLGTLGEFASNAGITVGLMLAWSPEAQKPISVLLCFPGLSAASQELLSLHGVAKLAASKYELVYEGTVNGTEVNRWILKLNDIALRILGIGFPRNSKPSLFIFGPPGKQPEQPGTTEVPLGWYGVYRKS